MNKYIKIGVVCVIIMVLVMLISIFLLLGPMGNIEIMGSNVHGIYHDRYSAAQLMQEVKERNDTLITYLVNKYGQTATFDPDASGKIDVIPSVLPGDDGPNFKKNAVRRLEANYDPELVYEISPSNLEGNTSYTVNKKKLVLCLRHKKKGYKLHHINTVMFVVIHELSHMANDEWDHSEKFWKIFKFMLESGVKAGVYTPVNYANHPVTYCGLHIAYNPLFDAGLVIPK